MKYVEFPEAATVEPIPSVPAAPDCRFNALSVQERYQVWVAGVNDNVLNDCADQDERRNEYIEVLFPEYHTKLILDALPAWGECAALRVQHC
jgi:hypothetical protein